MSAEAGAAPDGGAVQITIDDFLRVKLRIGIIQTAEVHPNADRLLVLQVDIGEGKPRQLVAGSKESYEPSQLARLFQKSGPEPSATRRQSQGFSWHAVSPVDARTSDV